MFHFDQKITITSDIINTKHNEENHRDLRTFMQEVFHTEYPNIPASLCVSLSNPAIELSSLNGLEQIIPDEEKILKELKSHILLRKILICRKCIDKIIQISKKINLPSKGSSFDLDKLSNFFLELSSYSESKKENLRKEIAFSSENPQPSFSMKKIDQFHSIFKILHLIEESFEYETNTSDIQEELEISKNNIFKYKPINLPEQEGKEDISRTKDNRESILENLANCASKLRKITRGKDTSKTTLKEEDIILKKRNIIEESIESIKEIIKENKRSQIVHLQEEIAYEEGVVSSEEYPKEGISSKEGIFLKKHNYIPLSPKNKEYKEMNSSEKTHFTFLFAMIQIKKILEAKKEDDEENKKLREREIQIQIEKDLEIENPMNHIFFSKEDIEKQKQIENLIMIENSKEKFLEIHTKAFEEIINKNPVKIREQMTERFRDHRKNIREKYKAQRALANRKKNESKTSSFSLEERKRTSDILIRNLISEDSPPPKKEVNENYYNCDKIEKESIISNLESELIKIQNETDVNRKEPTNEKILDLQNLNNLFRKKEAVMRKIVQTYKKIHQKESQSKEQRNDSEISSLQETLEVLWKWLYFAEQEEVSFKSKLKKKEVHL